MTSQFAQAGQVDPDSGPLVPGIMDRWHRPRRAAHGGA